jgi:PAP2 superfamily
MARRLARLAAALSFSPILVGANCRLAALLGVVLGQSGECRPSTASIGAIVIGRFSTAARPVAGVYGRATTRGGSEFAILPPDPVGTETGAKSAAMRWTSLLSSGIGRGVVFPNTLFLTARPLLNDNRARWIFIAIAGLVSAVGLWKLNVTIVWKSLWWAIEFDVLLLLCAAIYGIVGAQAPRLERSTAIVSDLLLWILQLIVALKAFTPLTYLAAASGYPLVDGELTRLDAMVFGFNWNVEANWVASHPALDWLLQQAYFSVYYQGAFVFLIGSVRHPGDRNGELIWQFCISLALTCAVFAFTPALAHVAHAGTGWLKTLITIRSGEWDTLDFSRVEGIISFPSFHTTLAILLVYAVRHHHWALAVLLPLNMLLIVATLSVGGHYLVDLPAGAAVAVVGIAATRLLRRQLAKRRPLSFLDLAGAAAGFRTGSSKASTA